MGGVDVRILIEAAFLASVGSRAITGKLALLRDQKKIHANIIQEHPIELDAPIRSLLIPTSTQMVVYALTNGYKL
jgi:hypothetical protein